MKKVNPQTTELYKLRLRILLDLWNDVFGTEPSPSEMLELDKAKNNKRQYEEKLMKLEILKAKNRLRG